ncbi:hypothetical protein H0H93_009700 [Arthromyces matolae]|nr:hypothetical protein H0H93_009700 [Arthromyces matolae]
MREPNSVKSDKLPKTYRYSVPKLLILGLVFHLVYIGTVFDCYFTSPVVHGMQNHSVAPAEAKRLVLIVGDGLRADLLFNEDAFPTIPDAPKVIAPYLKSIAETRGAFGISHTRVPTESRPGHVAIIGGNQADSIHSHTFSFGSPDILPMFARGATTGKVQTWCYHEEDEDFTKGKSNLANSGVNLTNNSDATFLDIWVLDHLKELLRNATRDETLNEELHSDKVVFFLHLLGLDTTGHSYRPHSQEYMNNIRVVDNIVRETESLVNDFYQDGETSFIFSADHGMSVIGNHGDGDPDNTRTPLIAWGRGIRGPLPDSNPSSHDSYSQSWGLSHLYRRDVEQADLAAMMASLLGIDWPVNSVGVLPDVDPTRPGYLSPRLGDQTLAQAAFVNAKVLLEQYTTKHELKKSQTLFYKPFVALEEGNATHPVPHRIASLVNIENLIQAQDWRDARLASAKLIRTSLAGLHYLQTYDRLLIRGIVTVAYFGWAAYASLYIFCPLRNVAHHPEMTSSLLFVHALAVMTLSGFWVLFALQHAPYTFYVYIAFPCYFWHQFLVQTIPVFQAPRSGNYWKGLARFILVVGVLQAMVLAYTYRFIWSIGFAFIGVVWPMTWPHNVLQSNIPSVAVWAFLCLVSAIFPVLSVEKQESLPLILVGGGLVLLCSAFAAPWVLQGVEVAKGRKSRQTLGLLFTLQAMLIVAIMVVTAGSVRSLQAKHGLPFANRVLGWIILGIASLIPLLSGGKHHTAFSKFLLYFLGFGPCFIILSISVEGLFYVTYSCVLMAWVVVESSVRNGALHMTIDRKGTTKVYNFEVGFFGTGNPFIMAALLTFKIVAPYIILAIAFALLNDFLHLPPFSLLLVALTLTDDTRSNAACALVCNGWMESALDTLWQRIHRLEYLLRILGPMGDPSQRHSRVVTFLQLHITNDRWERFSYYSKRIRHLEVTDYPTEIHERAFSTLSFSRPILYLLPNLRHLRWAKDPKRPALSLVLCLLFLTPDLRSLSVDTGHFDHQEGDLFAIDNFFKDVVHRSPRIESFEFHSDILYHDLGPSLCNFLLGLPHLKTVVISDHLLTSDVVTALAKCPHLHSIRTNHNSDSNQMEDLENFMPVIGPAAFPCLKEMEIRSHIWNAVSFLTSEFPAARLRHLSVQTILIEEGNNVGELFKIVADVCPGIESLELSMTSHLDAEHIQRTPGLQFGDLEPLLRCTSLTSLKLSVPAPLDVDNLDVGEMAAAWPRLRELRLNAKPERTEPESKHITFEVMASFAQHCPQLEVLELYIESFYIPSLEARKPLRNLRNLDLGLVGTNYTPEDLASFLTDITPSKCHIGGSPYVFVDVQPQSRAVANVAYSKLMKTFGLIPMLRNIHAQYRDRLLTLEDEVSRLSTLLSSATVSR